MISLEKFLNGCKRNADRIKEYKLGKSGNNGQCDCIGFPIGALELEGQKWGGMHGSNYAVRFRTKNLHQVSNASQLRLGELVYKVRRPGDANYDLKERYLPGGKMYTGDLNDYYHVGVVTSVNPLTISHCSEGGMHYDKTLGAWSYAGYCSLVDYGSEVSTDIPVQSEPQNPTGRMVVDVPNDTSVNVRSKPSMSANVLTRLPEGSPVDVTSVSGEWSHVKYAYRKTGSGYVMSKFIRDGVIDVPDDTSVNVRKQPNRSASRITTLPEGSTVTVLVNEGAWSKVDYAFPASGSGYVMSKYLRKG